MGLCASKGDDDGGRSRSNQIDKQLKEGKQAIENEVKLLLLGAGESGKSTIFKQMRIIHQEGYSQEERMAFKDVIYSNTIQSMKVLINGSFTKDIPLDTDDHEQLAERILNLSATGEAFTAEIGKAIQELWNDKGIQQTFECANEFQLNDSAKYYFDCIDRISDPNYLPTQDDVLRSRVRTTGIVETVFNVGGLQFRMVDVGGQRNERKKWIHCFQDVTAVIFVTSLSEYDQVLYEDETQNRMKESLNLFDEICNSRWFADTSLILFLNKTDLFKEKIAQTDLSVCFPEYTGGKDFDNASKFITDKFLELNKNPNKTVYTHLTCATDTKNVKVIFAAVKDTIVQTSLKKAGFM
eukprot:TRINITY_DN1713_c2_g5_i2.p1 TRINITY_DN1713_c2_g5~~TRINITY_DN1713_c2_g5_i2.p1  ORF type:complete len:353 (-),score=128.43 TRINITY_DN1713_c2_g5_i2:366-1424(-)